jgi:hypothetical protein
VGWAVAPCTSFTSALATYGLAAKGSYSKYVPRSSMRAVGSRMEASICSAAVRGYSGALAASHL